MVGKYLAYLDSDMSFCVEIKDEIGTHTHHAITY